MSDLWLRLLGTMMACCFLGTALGEEIRVSARVLSDVAIRVEGRAAATVVAVNHAVIAAEVSGVIASIAVDVADRVEAGQILMELHDRDYQLAVESAMAALGAQDARIEQARERLERARDLNDRSFASVEDLRSRETELAVLTADRQARLIAVSQAQRSLEKTRIRAPFAGTIYHRDAQAGAYVAPGTPVVTLVQTESPELEAELNPMDVESLASSESIVFSSAGREWPVTLLRVSAVIGERSGMQKTRLGFDTDAPLVGRGGYLVWRQPQYALPAHLVVNRDGDLGVFVVEGQSARFVHLPQAQEGRPSLVTMPATTRIIEAGRERVRDGDRIIVDS